MKGRAHFTGATCVEYARTPVSFIFYAIILLHVQDARMYVVCTCVLLSMSVTAYLD